MPATIVTAAVKLGAQYTINRFKNADGFTGRINFRHPTTAQEYTYTSKNRKEFDAVVQTRLKIERYLKLEIDPKNDEIDVEFIVNTINESGIDPKAKDFLGLFADALLSSLEMKYPGKITYKLQESNIMPTNSRLDEPNLGQQATALGIDAIAALPAGSDLREYASSIDAASKGAQRIVRAAKNTAGETIVLERAPTTELTQSQKQSNPLVFAAIAAGLGFYFLG